MDFFYIFFYVTMALVDDAFELKKMKRKIFLVFLDVCVWGEGV